MFPANQIAAVILSRHGSWMSSMQLQKVLYYVQSWHLAVTDEPLFPERFKAWTDGPVVPQVWAARREQTSRDPVRVGDTDVELDELSSNLIDLVLATYGSHTGDELSALTHTELPWLEARGETAEDSPSTAPISNERIAQFYRSDRRIGGRTAADLAAGGIHVDSPSVEAFDIDELLASITDAEPVDEWGGANLSFSSSAMNVAGNG